MEQGYRELLQLLNDHQKELSALELDLFGSGEDSNEVQEAAKKVESGLLIQMLSF